MQVNNIKPYQSMKRGIWLARDKSGALYAYSKKPSKILQDDMFVPSYHACSSMLCLQTNDEKTQRFPEVTWENSPVFAELDLML